MNNPLSLLRGIGSLEMPVLLLTQIQTTVQKLHHIKLKYLVQSSNVRPQNHQLEQLESQFARKPLDQLKNLNSLSRSKLEAFNRSV